jgi:hypothetical protein
VHVQPGGAKRYAHSNFEGPACDEITGHHEYAKDSDGKRGNTECTDHDRGESRPPQD